MFFAERECSKILGLSAKPGPLVVAGIVGTGLMGGGITMCCAETGMQVFLLDIRTNHSMCLSCVTLLCVGCFASSLDDNYISREVVVGGTYLESNFVILTKLRCACQLPLWSPQFGMGWCILSCVWLSV